MTPAALLRIDVPAHQAWLGDHPLDFGRMEFRLLVELARHEGAVVTHRQLLANVWGNRHNEETKTVGTHVYKLRRQLGENMIRGVKGVGYMLAAGSVAELLDPAASATPPAAELDMATLLYDSIAHLQAYIDQRAAELAAPHIAAAGAAAAEQVAEARRAQERAGDLVAELRRQVRALEQQRERAGDRSGPRRP